MNIESERAAFEVFVRSDAWMFAPDLTRNPATEDYWDVEEQTGWISWQARAALTASAPTYRTRTTTPGEAVAGIALRQLGDESRWVEVRDLNAHAFTDIGPHDYYPAGTVLRLPPASAPNHSEQVREGWQLVPVELDTAMLRAMMEQITKSPVTWCRYRAAYRAMLATAPSAGSQGGV